MSLSLKSAELRRVDHASSLSHAYLLLEVDVDGAIAQGVSCEGKLAQAFGGGTSLGDELLAATRAALDFAKNINAKNVFEFWIQLNEAMVEWGEEQACPSGIAQQVLSLVERALIDALCRAKGTTFAEALHANVFGIELEKIHPYLKGQQPGELLGKPLEQLSWRLAIGLADAPTESIEGHMRAVGLRHFSISLSGGADSDLARLRTLAKIVGRACTHGYAFSLDGGGRFATTTAFRDLLERANADPALKSFMRNLDYVKQPFGRDMAYDNSVVALFAEWPTRPAIIIDQPDVSLQPALDWGYAGATHRNSCGVIKGIANRCLINALKTREPIGKYMMAGSASESVDPVSLLQDLTVQSCLGNASIELGGEQVSLGLSCLPKSLRQAVMAHHDDLFSVSSGGVPQIRSSEGLLAIGSLLAAPFGYGFDLPPDGFEVV